MKPLFSLLVIFFLLGLGVGEPVWAGDVPKKLLVVSITTGFRHESIPALKRMLTELGQASGEFTVDFLDQPDGKPADLKKDATPEEKAAHQAAQKEWEETKLKPALEKLTPAALQGYDGVVFASTTGDLPIPDKEGFLRWIQAGHAFIGLHSASDTFHQWPSYADMLGGEFDHHGAQVSVDILNADSKNPATAGLPKVWTLAQEEIYQFKKTYDPAKVHELLYMDKNPNDKTPGHYPLSWCKEYGAGRVFYTALGHRDDIIDPDPSIKDRKNAVEISNAYRAHVLGGIEWALGIAPTAKKPVTGSVDTASPRKLLDPSLSAWELWMGVPHQTVVGLPPGTPTSPDGHEGTPLGLGNDPKHVFTVEMQEGEPVLHITGEIFGGLTSKETFSNYHFRTEFKWGDRKWEPKLTVVRDNGILFDCTGPHGIFWHVWKRSLEFQVEEGNMGDLYCLNGTGATVAVAQGSDKIWYYNPVGELKPAGASPGAVQGKIGHLPGKFEKPNGEWNRLDLYTIGRTAVFVINGQIVNVLHDAEAIEGPQKTEVPLDAGQIQLQSEGAECYYRRIEISPIADYPPEIKKAAGL